MLAICSAAARRLASGGGGGQNVKFWLLNFLATPDNLQLVCQKKFSAQKNFPAGQNFPKAAAGSLEHADFRRRSPRLAVDL
jgi:hypothetical protein